MSLVDIHTSVKVVMTAQVEMDGKKSFFYTRLSTPKNSKAVSKVKGVRKLSS